MSSGTGKRKHPDSDPPVEETKEESKSPPKQPKPDSSGPGSASGLEYDSWLAQFHPTWLSQLQPFLDAGKLRPIHTFVSQEYRTVECRPIASEIFTAFNTTPFDQVKVVIVGQDPYPGPTEAMGMSFSVHRGVKVPGSLKNIYKCIQTDKKLGIKPANHGDLTGWAVQGVFLLNAVLTVRKGSPNTHAKKGWETFTDEVIRLINENRTNVVFMLWGAFAQAKAAGVDKSKHLVLEACHPSPLSASKGGFFTCGHFSRANEYLQEHGQTPIDWTLPS